MIVKNKIHPAERSLYMKDNAFTKYFILILLLLCVVVTPFAAHPNQERSILPDTTVTETHTPEKSETEDGAYRLVKTVLLTHSNSETTYCSM